MEIFLVLLKFLIYLSLITRLFSRNVQTGQSVVGESSCEDPYLNPLC